ncbi:hypothetical protein PDIG_87660 [Penicillium digitatum PHI26]|uniref:Uncharacterized protein n=2 Tax=Penicillium digitatum TaxID=36651 RepID=K9FUB3_PEND2|nr:hypothetical protein PDIP_33680 [Penicillium digitatum Pd1]EKV04681.1 hypothetical protein PDIG_87660 [Penicillium digitatum PHI26]EKV16849.1 hypothetical protein PDIP_33680 [Penicillium digitatum Pd1]
MPTVLSKFAGGELIPHDSQSAASSQGQDAESELYTQLLSSDNPEMSQAEIELLQTHEDQPESQQCIQKAQTLSTNQYTTHETRVPELLNPGSLAVDIALPEVSGSADQDFGKVQSKSDGWNDEKAGLTLGNGQLRLKIENWQTPGPKFAVENYPKGNPKCELHGEIASPKMVHVDFKVPAGYPGGMMGIMQSIEALFMSPRKIAMSNIETGSAPALRESKNPKRDNYYINWTTPWEISGCRVSWMKTKEKSPTLKFKFVSARNAKAEEQMLVTVDEREEFYQNISKNDPSTYGKWMALPVRIWLRIQWLISETGGSESNLFGKLLVDRNTLSSIKKDKGKKASKKPQKSARKPFTAEEGRSEDEKPYVPAMQTPEESVLGHEHTMETVGSQEMPQEDFTKQNSTQKVLTKRVSTLTIDTQKSNKRSNSKGKGKGKRMPGSSGSDIGKKNSDHITDQIDNQRADDRCGDLLPGVLDIARQHVPTEQQLAAVAGQQTVNAPQSPIYPNDLSTPISLSFETARTHFSPHTPHPSSSLSSFFTPMSISWKKWGEGGGEVKAEEIELAETSDELCLASRGDEVGMRCPVSDNVDEVWCSDPEELLGGHKVQEPILRRWLFRSQENAQLSPTADPPSSSCASSASSTTDSAEFGKDDPSPDGVALRGEKSLTESSRSGKKTAYKKKKHERRRRKHLTKRHQVRHADVENLVSSASSQGDGVEGRSPSPPELFEDDEPTPTAKQFGKIGAQTSELQMDLHKVGIACQKRDCKVLCAMGDGVSVICPKCGPFSLVRYCGKSHLWEDAKRHWEVCTMLPVLEQHLASLIPYDDLMGPPMLPCLHLWDTPQRHRQALWFSSARDRGDYFLFEELDDPVKAEDAPSHIGLRCSPRIANIVRFEDAEEKDRFRRCLAICLFAAVEHPALVDYLYRLVRDWMRAHNMWASDKDMDSMLCHQMKLEMGYTIDESRLGLRHACETEWVGADRRHCEDLTCASERRPTLLGNHRMGLGFRRVCEALESNYWILRAHRATHPSVSDVVARTCGAGFSEVLSMDRQTFCRGVGWDGAGTGPMELEMPWLG